MPPRRVAGTQERLCFVRGPRRTQGRFWPFGSGRGRAVSPDSAWPRWSGRPVNASSGKPRRRISESCAGTINFSISPTWWSMNRRQLGGAVALSGAAPPDKRKTGQGREEDPSGKFPLPCWSVAWSSAGLQAAHSVLFHSVPPLFWEPAKTSTRSVSTRRSSGVWRGCPSC